MRRAFSFFLGLAIAASVCLAAPERSVSTSRQFILYGPDARLRSAVGDLAERTKKIALTLLDERDAWKTPIVINAHYPEANLPETPPSQLDVSQTGAGLKLQLELVIGSDVNGPRVERELLRAIFLEMMYRALPQVPAGAAYIEPPDWLVDGALALVPERDPAEIAQTLNTAVNSGGVLPLEEFLRQQPSLMETPSRNVYRAYSAALVAMLIDLPNGRARLARFLADLPRSGNDSLGNLRAHFPDLGENAEALQKNWALNVARVCAAERYRLLGCEETERRLAELLRVEVPERAQNQLTVFGLEEFSTFLRDPAAPGALRSLKSQLLLLSGRAHPLYRPIIAEYLQIISSMERKKTKHLTERLAKIRGTREHVNRRMSAIGDYMNWFEATQARSTSGAFREYLNAAEGAREPERRRHDPISVYLDALEAQLGD
ncbi:MAG: hypothetical protein ACXWG7_08580 [Chthoniobacterales bacterium]